MSPKASKSKTAVYQGAYVSQIRDTLVASALSGVHAVLLSGPGYGKTRIAKAVAEKIYGPRLTVDSNGEEGWAFFRFEASTPPEAVKGMPDPAALLDSPPRLYYDPRNTMYDPRAHMFIADEMFRPSDPVFDTLLDTLDRQDHGVDVSPVVWGTSNYVASGERLRAIIDRVGLWLWLEESYKPFTVATSHLLREFNKDLDVDMGDRFPTYEDIYRIRTTRPTTKSVNAVVEMISRLEESARSDGFAEHMNPRRITHWANILMRLSIFYHDTEDFDIVHFKAVEVIKYAYPLDTRKKAEKWAEVVRATADVIGAAMEAAKVSAYAAFRAAQNEGDKATRMMKLGAALAEAQKTLAALRSQVPDQSRVSEINKMDVSLTEAYSRAMIGEELF